MSPKNLTSVETLLKETQANMDRYMIIYKGLIL